MLKVLSPICLNFKTEKRGECPDMSGLMGICVEGCSGDSDCPGEQKCCSNGCGHTCMDPVMHGEGI